MLDPVQQAMAHPNNSTDKDPDPEAMCFVTKSNPATVPLVLKPQPEVHPSCFPISPPGPLQLLDPVQQALAHPDNSTDKDPDPEAKCFEAKSLSAANLGCLPMNIVGFIHLLDVATQQALAHPGNSTDKDPDPYDSWLWQSLAYEGSFHTISSEQQAMFHPNNSTDKDPDPLQWYQFLFVSC
jgi:hypothetical protein